ncbi:PoNe immunity protein domain-containing protein [Ideonella oryzae]|uniref:DUF1911 domain-containing protein n=1 Tax=Ideonella oryzae TaxID=2937441 RepID=A0ABT1BRR5_9BURK|nr:PoNe immunity protein domain-containing protein [Ideonella oryzae]MCO5978808.1 DUF1911 domain-containing protein [Ideonella oryzae]
MELHKRRRQQFLGETYYTAVLKSCDDGVEAVGSILRAAVAEGDIRYAHGRARVLAETRFDRLTLRYTAGEPIELLRSELEHVVAAYERYGDLLWSFRKDRNEVVFEFDVIDDYCQLMQLVGLCFLLHRRDLMPRIAALQDGVDATGQKGQGMGGADWVFEEFMSFAVGPEHRYESETIHWPKPYEALADALSSADNDAALKDLDRFLKHWYKDLAGTGWHDSHKPDENGNQGGYYGYWSFEAGAALLLLGIEDDSSLHKYLYYPKDLVAWAREHAKLSQEGATAESESLRLRCEAGHPCPKSGFWFTPARAGSRQRFEARQVMPEVGGDYGATIWQWDDQQG